MLLGTIVNCVAIIIGTLIGISLRKHFPEKIKQIVFQCLGLSVLVIGLQSAIKAQNLLILIFSLLIGGVIGQWLGLDQLFEKLGEKIKKLTGSTNANFTEGIVTGFLIYCVGSLTILGAINEGLTGDHSLLFTKSALDGFTSVALASTLGIGVAFSVVPLLIYQGALTILASLFKDFFTPAMILSLTATGGVLIMTIGLNLLEIKRIKTANLLPALLIAIILAMIVK